MAKELPYFKFHINEWFNGDITLEDYELQGIFVNICAYYWSKDCNLSKPSMLKKFRGLEDKIEQLISSKIIKIIGENVRISFLNEQYGSKEVQKIANRQNGLLGGRPRKEKTEEKPNGLNFANPNESETKPKHNQYRGEERKEDIDNTIVADFSETKNTAPLKKSFEERKKAFRETLRPHTRTPSNPEGKFEADMVGHFFEKWTEPNKSKTKMKFEMEKTWDVVLRLGTWKRNGFGEKKETVYTSSHTSQGSAPELTN